MNVHYLKTAQPYFQQVADRIKRFEIRKDDRGAEAGDLFMLQEVGVDEKFTGNQILVLASTKLKDVEKYGLKKGFAIFGIKFYEELDTEIEAEEEIRANMRKICNSPLDAKN